MSKIRVCRHVAPLSRRVDGGIINIESAGVKSAWAATAFGRFGDPLGDGALVAFLMSDRANYMNETCIAVDDGALKRIT